MEPDRPESRRLWRRSARCPARCVRERHLAGLPPVQAERSPSRRSRPPSLPISGRSGSGSTRPGSTDSSRSSFRVRSSRPLGPWPPARAAEARGSTRAARWSSLRTLDRAFARWCFTVECDRSGRCAAPFSDPPRGPRRRPRAPARLRRPRLLVSRQPPSRGEPLIPAFDTCDVKRLAGIRAITATRPTSRPGRRSWCSSKPRCGRSSGRSRGGRVWHRDGRRRRRRPGRPVPTCRSRASRRGRSVQRPGGDTRRDDFARSSEPSTGREAVRPRASWPDAVGRDSRHGWTPRSTRPRD